MKRKWLIKFGAPVLALGLLAACGDDEDVDPVEDDAPLNQDENNGDLDMNDDQNNNNNGTNNNNGNTDMNGDVGDDAGLDNKNNENLTDDSPLQKEEDKEGNG